MAENANYWTILCNQGDNTVLLQQASNYLLKKWKEKKELGTPIEGPFGSINYLDTADERLTRKDISQLSTVEQLTETYRFLVTYLLKRSADKLDQNLTKFNGDMFTAKSQTQVYYLRTLSIAYFECEAITRFAKFISEDVAIDLRPVLTKLCLLYGLWSLEKHLSILYEANYFKVGYPAVTSCREMILQLCSELKNEAVALVDVFAPPDFILNSCLGFSDGRIYDHIFDALTHNKGSFDRPDWLLDTFAKKPDQGVDVDAIRAKLWSKVCWKGTFPIGLPLLLQ